MNPASAERLDALDVFALAIGLALCFAINGCAARNPAPIVNHYYNAPAAVAAAPTPAPVAAAPSATVDEDTREFFATLPAALAGFLAGGFARFAELCDAPPAGELRISEDQRTTVCYQDGFQVAIQDDPTGVVQVAAVTVSADYVELLAGSFREAIGSDPGASGKGWIAWELESVRVVIIVSEDRKDVSAVLSRNAGASL